MRPEQLIGGSRNRALCPEVALGPLLKGDFDRGTFGDPGAAMDAIDGALALEHLQIAPDGCQGRADGFRQCLDRREAVGIEMAANGVETLDLQPYGLTHPASFRGARHAPLSIKLSWQTINVNQKRDRY